ncbi:MAG: FliA/WhiG family RNA polymerase sigma factor [Deltaproteobacteria bacterium]|nr:FliA/WhiG family RNA polymerase sigma factor [Deltaproteobacteria bacterium]MBI3295009.1 FliA/WhiG family RNA polymerase sigma factor [Deltaproteobacteria bacterium]
MAHPARKYKETPKKVDKRTKEKLILEYSPLIKFIAQKIAVRLPSNIEFDDLVSSGVIGLMDAIDKYDPTRDNKFKTYAEFRIRGAILDELRAQDWVPRSVREKAKQLEKAHLRLERELGRTPTEDEITKELQMTKDEYYDLLNQVKSVSILSLDEAGSFNSSDRKSILSLLESCKIPSPLAHLNMKTVKLIVTRSIESLPEKQRLVLSLYYYEDLNLKEIGDVLEVTESRVSQLHTQAILWLRRKLKSHFEELEVR